MCPESIGTAVGVSGAMYGLKQQSAGISRNILFLYNLHDGWGGEITFVQMWGYITRRSSLQMINAIQEALAPVGQTHGTTAPTVSAMSRLHGSVGQLTGAMPQGFLQCVRIRSLLRVVCLRQ